jgi:hypothetical protein
MQRRMSNRDRIAHLRAEADAAAKERADRAAAKSSAKPSVRSSAKSGGRARAAKPVGRVRFVWSVCGPSGKEVIRFPYAQEEQARADAAQRTASTGQTHFVTKAEEPVA